MNINFRKANTIDSAPIWKILKDAILRRKKDGSNQWQDGYPNPESVQNDIEKGVGFVLTENDSIIGYSAVLINDEPEYANIVGQWISNTDFVVFHRVAIAETHLGKGMAKLLFTFIEEFAKDNNINSIKADTNFDNGAMLSLFDKSGYVYCGEVHFRGSPRKAYEKVLEKT